MENKNYKMKIEKWRMKNSAKWNQRKNERRQESRRGKKKQETYLKKQDWIVTIEIRAIKKKYSKKWGNDFVKRKWRRIIEQKEKKRNNVIIKGERLLESHEHKQKENDSLKIKKFTFTTASPLLKRKWKKKERKDAREKQRR